MFYSGVSSHGRMHKPTAWVENARIEMEKKRRVKSKQKKPTKSNETINHNSLDEQQSMIADGAFSSKLDLLSLFNILYKH